jgi:hypothetical protein
VKTVIVTGGRHYNDGWRIWDVLREHKAEVIVTGDATGADYYARGFAQQHALKLHVYEADWRKHGTAAGPIRNRAMLDAHPNAIVLAFPGGRGTADCVRQARALKMEVIEVGVTS